MNYLSDGFADGCATGFKIAGIIMGGYFLWLLAKAFPVIFVSLCFAIALFLLRSALKD